MAVPKAARQMYDVTSTDVMTSEHSIIDGYGFAKRKQQGQNYTYGSIKQGYTLNLSQTRIGLMDAITWEMRKFDKYREIDKKMRALGETTAKRIELDLTHLFTFGMSAASYTNMDTETIATTSADGQNIFDTDHTITGGSDTYSNLITTAFSRAGLEEAENKFNTFVDNNGNIVLVEPDTIITGRNVTIQNSVKEFLKSTLVPDEANNATNVYSGKYKHLVLPFLGTTAAGAPTTSYDNYWMLADLKHKDALCEISEEPTFTAPTMGGNGEDFETDDWKFKSSACYDYGVLDFKWIVGSTGATS
ncbi:MAG: hypothetical protein WC803_12680 [Sphingomonas sp.]|jgi:hypothetical protein